MNRGSLLNCQSSSVHARCHSPTCHPSHVLHVEQSEIRRDLQKRGLISRVGENSIPQHLLLELPDVDQLVGYIVHHHVHLLPFRATAIEYRGHSIERLCHFVILGSRRATATVQWGLRKSRSLGSESDCRKHVSRRIPSQSALAPLSFR